MQLRKFSQWQAAVVSVFALLLIAPVLGATEGTGGDPSAESPPSGVAEASTGVPDAATANEDTESAAEPEPVTVREALVAIRGDRGTGLGALVEIKGDRFVLTSLSALAPNRRMSVQTSSGQLVPVARLVGAVDADIALLQLGEGAEGLPVVKAKLDAELESGDKLTIQSPHEALEISSGSLSGGRLETKSLEVPVFSGAPVVLDGEVVGVFSPASNVYAGVKDGSSAASKDGNVWEAGLVLLEPDLEWQSVDPLLMSTQYATLEETAEQLKNLSVLLRVGSMNSESLTAQPLIAAQSRLKQNLLDLRGSDGAELERAYQRFEFSVRSYASEISPTLATAGRDYYGYFQPTIRVLETLYEPVSEKLAELKANPSKARSYAR